MSIQSPNRSCRLKRFEFPRYWEEIVENPLPADQLVARIKQLHAGYQPEKAEGISSFLEDNQGNHFQVGCSDEGWVLTGLTHQSFPDLTGGERTSSRNSISQPARRRLLRRLSLSG